VLKIIDLQSIKIGWVGLGSMGMLMSKRILDAGYSLTVYNRTASKSDNIVKMGALKADSLQDLAMNCRVIFTMVSDYKALDEIMSGESGLIQSAKPGTVFIDMSTISAEASASIFKLLDEKNMAYLRAPVTGSTSLAATGKLGILVSGSKSVHDEICSLFLPLGENVFYLGAAEEARFMKTVINIMVGITGQMMGEALILGKKAGLDWQKMLDVITKSAVATPLVCYKSQLLADRDYSPMFSVKLMEKDFDIALSTGKNLNVPIPVTGLVRQLLAIASATGKSDLDFISLVKLSEELSGMSEN